MSKFIMAIALVLTIGASKSQAATSKYSCGNVGGTDEWTIYVDLDKKLAGFFDNDSTVVVPFKSAKSLESFPPQMVYTFEGLDSGGGEDSKITITFNQTKLSGSVSFLADGKITTKNAESKCEADSSVDLELDEEDAPVAIAPDAMIMRPFTGKTILSCAVNKVTDTSIFEESLSVEEYPEISVTERIKPACAVCPAFSTSYEVSIGMSSYTSAEGNSITKTTDSKGRIKNIAVRNENSTILLKVAKARNQKSKMTLEVTEAGKTKKVARGTCKMQ